MSEIKKQPCNDYAADWRGEHKPHNWERREGQYVHCFGRSFTREERWDQALSEWTTFIDADGHTGICMATPEQIRAECMALADHELAMSHSSPRNVAAARALIELAEKTGEEVEDWIRELAKGER